MRRLGQNLQVFRIVVGLVFVPMVDLLTGAEQATEFVFHQHDVKRIKTLRVAPWMRRISAAKAIATALTGSQDSEHGSPGKTPDR